jgi:hypothetical protein
VLVLAGLAAVGGLNAAAAGDGACIVGGASCQLTATEADCTALGGVFVGDGSTCATSVGACCLPDGGCELSTVDACAGTFAGPGTTCATTACPQPGACCFATGDCVQTELTGGGFDVGGTCAELGGSYLGDGTTCDGNTCDEPGWNWVDNEILLTKNEPAWWSAATGQPKGVSPFTVLDPAGEGLPGRVDPDGTGERVLRGYLVAWAVDGEGREIRWNHLAGTATVVDYGQSAAWEHNAWSFPAVATVANGDATGDPGVLNLDGAEFVRPFDQLIMDFWAVGELTLGGTVATVDTDVTLLPVDVDLRQETGGPTTTKAVYSVWNQNEVKFSGLDRCITCWDERPVGSYEAPNHFLQINLQTDKGRVRIDAVASTRCNRDDDPADGLPLGDSPNDLVSADAALLGVAARYIRFQAGNQLAIAGTNLHGIGTQSAVIRHDVVGPPPEALAEPVVSDVTNAPVLSATPPVSPRVTSPGTAPVTADRVSASEKGSLLIFPKIELRWDAAGNLVQDTFVTLSNDFPEDVRVQMYFINGDGPR